MIVKIKTIALYEIEVEDIPDAIRHYNEGMWDQKDIVEDDAFELGYIDENNEYKVILPTE